MEVSGADVEHGPVTAFGAEGTNPFNFTTEGAGDASAE